MPTPKWDASARAAKTLKEKADKIEELLEAEIAKGKVRISLGQGQFAKDTTIEVLRVVAERYQKAGWDAHYADDQRDGMYITIS